MPSVAESWQQAWASALAAGDYLRALRLVRDAADDREPISYDVVAYLLQAVGRVEDADAVQRRRAELERARGLDALPAALRAAVQQVPRTPPLEARQITLDEALEILPAAVAEHRVIIVGEEHHHPEHRAFGARLLGRLRTAGVTHLALETGEQARLDAARQSGRVTPTTDGFSFEPQRAGLLRSALALDLPIVAFDLDAEDATWAQSHPENVMAFRERRMAEHLVDRILGPEPAARAVVWVGYGHAQKIDLGLKMMALHLWEITGEEPFCAYQLSSEGSRPGVDVVIRHPPPRYEHGRPDWLRVDGHSVCGVLEPPGECLVQLLPSTEGPASTPTDQLLTEADGAFELLVPEGDYLLRVWRGEGRPGTTEHLAVTRPIEGLIVRAESVSG